MKHLIKTATTFCLSAIGMLAMMSCEGADLYKVSAPDWLADKELPEEVLNIVEVTPNPAKLGAADNTTGFWEVFTDDVKTEPGMTYQLKFVNYGGNSNWKNFVIILRSEDKATEYAVLRADNWGWGTGYSGEESDSHFTKMTEDKRDWGIWLKAMSMAKCTALITNKDNGKADVKITMIGADNVTYTQEYTDILVDTDNLYFAFTLEGCHLEFGDFNIEDSEPVSMKLNGVPAKVKLGTTFEEAFANVTATVTFADEVAQDVEAKDLQIQALPDMNTVGKKSLIAVYNKTKLGGNATTPVIGTVDFEIVDKMYTCVGATDNSGGFASAFSEDFKVAAGETYVMTFTNYTNGAANWNNYLVELFNADKSKYYATVRADNYGWGDGYGTCTPVCDNGGDWATWLTAMNGAKVTTFVTNNGDGTADVKAVIIGNDGKIYKQEYNGITVDAADMYFHLTIEKAHLEFDTVVGAENNSGGFASDSSADYNIPAGATYVTRFTNYTDGAANWNNYLVELFSADKSKYYATVRADNYGWGDGYGTCTTVFDNGGDWATWLTAMNGAKVTSYVTNNGDGTADVKAVIIGSDGKTYKQEYNGITVDATDVNFHFIIEKAHLVFE
jgi:hypothetical protein